MLLFIVRSLWLSGVKGRNCPVFTKCHMLLWNLCLCQFNKKICKHLSKKLSEVSQNFILQSLSFLIKNLTLQLWKHTFNRLLVALAVFDLMFVCSTVPIHVFPLFEYNNRLFALLYSRWWICYFIWKVKYSEISQFLKGQTVCRALQQHFWHGNIVHWV